MWPSLLLLVTEVIQCPNRPNPSFSLELLGSASIEALEMILGGHDLLTWGMIMGQLPVDKRKGFELACNLQSGVCVAADCFQLCCPAARKDLKYWLTWSMLCQKCDDWWEFIISLLQLSHLSYAWGMNFESWFVFSGTSNFEKWVIIWIKIYYVHFKSKAILRIKPCKELVFEWNLNAFSKCCLIAIFRNYISSSRN